MAQLLPVNWDGKQGIMGKVAAGPTCAVMVIDWIIERVIAGVGHMQQCGVADRPTETLGDKI